MSASLPADSGPSWPPLVLIGSRILSMMVVLASIPVLIHFLGGEGFAAWAVLLAASVVCSVLEMGMSLTFVRHAVPPLHEGDLAAFDRIRRHAQLLLLLSFAVASVPAVLFAPGIARVLSLPDTPWFSGPVMLLLVFAASALRGLLQFGAHTFNAAQRVRAMAATTLASSLCSNLAAAVAAALSRRLDVCLVVFWASQIAVLLVSYALALRSLRPPSSVRTLDRRLLRELWFDGMKLQVHDIAQLVTFQLDKFLIAGVLGLWAVAPYEVGNRSVQALRSLPASGLDAFLANAVAGQARGGSDESWARYLAATRWAAWAVLVFMIAPLAVAPLFLYAWTGEMGYLARWAFLALMLGAAAQVLALPAAAMAQVGGRVGLQAHAALWTMLLNLPLSLVLMLHWHLTGAAVGTAMAMTAGALVLLLDVHRHYGRPLADTLKVLSECWVDVLFCTLLAVVAWAAFDVFVSAIDRDMRYSREFRLWPAILAVLGYGVLVLLLLLKRIHAGALSTAQRELLRRVVRWPRFHAYCEHRHRVP
jgi:O-antigen/teichoic acid export membrane protein